MRFHKFKTDDGVRYIDLDAIVIVEARQRLGGRDESLIYAGGFASVVDMAAADVVALVWPAAPARLFDFEQDRARIEKAAKEIRKGNDSLIPELQEGPTVTTIPADEALSLGIAARRDELVRLRTWFHSVDAHSKGLDNYIRNRLKAFERREV